MLKNELWKISYIGDPFQLVHIARPWLIADTKTLAGNFTVITFEMEGANIGCLVMKGVSDFADEHKNDWQSQVATNATKYLYPHPCMWL